MIRKILIANRGEIAVRIIRTARRLGIVTVAVYSRIDAGSLHVSQADESHCIGEADLADTYLNIGKLIDAARQSKCDAIHPGYGFLAENPEFVRACEAAGIIFIGPHAGVMEIMGNKIRAREFVAKTGIPMTRGLTGTKQELLDAAGSIPFPVLLKAAAGGGGKGMIIVRDPAELPMAIESASRQAMAYFGDDTVYLEQYIEEPRHIEVQVLGDNHGNVIHLFERECSIQRRYQKIIEESPSPTLTPELRREMGAAAVRIAKATGYNNAGTMEFLVGPDLRFYFLEMNTRIQVEHPVTEMVTGIDIVEEQIHVAAGNPLRLRQEDIKQEGHAIECRIYAEDPANNFLPSPGQMTCYIEPATENTRIDTGITLSTGISSAFDPMISKLIVWGNDREEATRLALAALKEYTIHGIRTNITYLIRILESEVFTGNRISTRFCDLHTDDLIRSIQEEKDKIPLHIPLTGFLLASLNERPCYRSSYGKDENIWERIGFWRNMISFGLTLDGTPFQVKLASRSGCRYEFETAGIIYTARLVHIGDQKVDFTIGNDSFSGRFSSDRNGNHYFSLAGHIFYVSRADFLPELVPASGHDRHGGSDDHVTAPMPGKVIRIHAGEGDEVRKGDPLLVLEAMKMENSLVAPRDAVIRKINVKLNQAVEVSAPLIEFEPQE